MDRRTFVAAMVSGLAAAPRSAAAQQPAAKVVKVGVLRAAPDAPLFRRNFELFRQALHQSGFVEGTSLTIEYRVRAGTAQEISGLAAELVRLRMDAIVAIGPAAVRAAAGRRRLPRSWRWISSRIPWPRSS